MQVLYFKKTNFIKCRQSLTIISRYYNINHNYNHNQGMVYNNKILNVGYFCKYKNKNTYKYESLHNNKILNLIRNPFRKYSNNINNNNSNNNNNNNNINNNHSNKNIQSNNNNNNNNDNNNRSLDNFNLDKSLVQNLKYISELLPLQKKVSIYLI